MKSLDIKVIVSILVIALVAIGGLLILYGGYRGATTTTPSSPALSETATTTPIGYTTTTSPTGIPSTTTIRTSTISVSTTTTTSPRTKSPIPTTTVVMKPSREELSKILSYIVKLREEISKYGYGVKGPVIAPAVLTVVTPTATPAVIREEVLSAKAETARVSGTNVQVEGVDELDIVKTDGKYIYFAYGNKVYIVDVRGEEPKVYKVIEVPYRVVGLFVKDDKLAIITSREYYRIMVMVYPPPPTYGGTTSILIYRIGEDIELVKNITITASLVAGRLSGK